MAPDPYLDDLVPLRNRRGFETDAQPLIATADADCPLALIAFDIDNFKAVNDKHGGHASGDQALSHVAVIAANCAKGKGTAYRVGGDEFILLLPNHTREEALSVAERLRMAVGESTVTERRLPLTVSVGVAVAPHDGRDLATLKAAADAAAYDAKARGRDLVRYAGEPAPAEATKGPTRKPPASTGYTDAERAKIYTTHLRGGVARCPRDQAILSVTDATGESETRARLIVWCRLCGTYEEIS